MGSDGRYVVSKPGDVKPIFTGGSFDEAIDWIGANHKNASINIKAYVEHVEGHVNSKGESSPWVIRQHNTGKILSSHKTKAEAEEHLKQMEMHKQHQIKQLQLITIV